MLAGTTDLGHQTPQEMIDAPPDWVSELISRLDEDLISTANAGAKTSGEPAGQRGEDAADPEGVPFSAQEPPVDDPAGAGTRNAVDAAEAGGETDGGGVLEAIFGWLAEVLASIFGKPAEEGMVADLPPPGSYVPDPPPDMSQDVVFIEYIPEVPVDETEAGIAEAREEDEDDLALCV